MIPNYLLRRLVNFKRVRLPKLDALRADDIVDLCPKCGEPVYKRRILGGAEQIDGKFYKPQYSRGQYYHLTCPTPDDDAQEDNSYHRWMNGWMSRSEKAAKEAKLLVAKGNLEQEEYRYWIGYDMEPAESSWAMCRTCRSSTYGKDQRKAHLNDPDFLVGGMNCSERVVEALRRISDTAICIVCKKPRGNYSKWGVPLCVSSSCERAWKFGQDRWIYLEKEFLRQKNMAALEQKKRVGKLAKAIIDSCGQEKVTTRFWCNSCGMFTDNMLHSVEHKKRVDRGEIVEN